MVKLDPATVFLDSSVLFAASLSGRGFARDLLLAGTRGEFNLFVSALVLAETEQNLHKKAPAGLTGYRLLRPTLSLASPSQQLVRDVALHVEAKDAPIVAGALAAGALYLATYDRRHLLAHARAIRAAFGVEVVTPDQLLGS